MHGLINKKNAYKLYGYFFTLLYITSPKITIKNIMPDNIQYIVYNVTFFISN